MNNLDSSTYFWLQEGHMSVCSCHAGLDTFLSSLWSTLLSLSLKTPRAFAKFMRLCHNIYLFGGRLNVVLGIAMISNGGVRPTELVRYWWIVVSILLWGVAEVVSKRLVKSDLNNVQDGIPPSKNLSIGFVLSSWFWSAFTCVWSTERYKLILIFIARADMAEKPPKISKQHRKTNAIKRES